MSARVQHQATLLAHETVPKQTRPHGKYTHSEFVWGKVANIHPTPDDPAGTIPSVDVYLEGAENRPPKVTIRLGS